MTVATLVPTSTVSTNASGGAGGAAVTSVGGTVPAIVTDANDATYVLLSSSTSGATEIVFALGTFTLGTGRLKSWQATARSDSTDPVVAGVSYALQVYAVNSVNGASYPFGSISLTPTTTNNTTVAGVPPTLTQAMIDGLQLRFYYNPQANTGARLREVSLAVTYAAIPVANITSPTGTPALGTSSPTVTWTHTPGADGGTQTHYEVKVFTAAQYGAGGFSPDTSAAQYASGIVTSNASSLIVGPLDNSTTFRVYLRTAQTINGTPHWSAWDFEGFTTAYTPSSVQTVTPVATSANGYITVTVARNTGTAAWSTVEVERLDPSGVWVPVRGATNPLVTVTNGFVTTYTTNSLAVRDYEAPNGSTVTYRARATTATGVVGAWVSSSTTSWSHTTDVYLKDVHNPNSNVRVLVEEMPQPATTPTQGVFDVIGSKYPVVVSDVRRSAVGTIVVRTETTGDAINFELALENHAKLLQFPAAHVWGSKYVALNTVQKAWYSPAIDIGYWQFQIGYVEIARPADETNYA